MDKTPHFGSRVVSRVSCVRRVRDTCLHSASWPLSDFFGVCVRERERSMETRFLLETRANTRNLKARVSFLLGGFIRPFFV